MSISLSESISTSSVQLTYSKPIITNNKKLYTIYKESSTNCYLKVYSIETEDQITFLKDVYLPYTTNCGYLLELESMQTRSYIHE